MTTPPTDIVPLPEPFGTSWIGDPHYPCALFTADQMRSYAAACVATAHEGGPAMRAETASTHLDLVAYALSERDNALDRLARLADPVEYRGNSVSFIRVRADALEHACACLDACGGWTVETLGHNIESAFGDDLDADECDDIAREALRRWT